MVTVHVPVPEQPPPDQPAKTEFAPGVAVKVTAVLVVKAWVQLTPQFMPVGVLTTVPFPSPVFTTFNAFSVALMILTATTLLTAIELPAGKSMAALTAAAAVAAIVDGTSTLALTGCEATAELPGGGSMKTLTEAIAVTSGIGGTSIFALTGCEATEELPGGESIRTLIEAVAVASGIGDTAILALTGSEATGEVPGGAFIRTLTGSAPLVIGCPAGGPPDSVLTRTSVLGVPELIFARPGLSAFTVKLVVPPAGIVTL